MARVVIVGGGYGGLTLARALETDLDVTLVDPGEAFVHRLALLRCVVDESWGPRLFFPYTGLLRRADFIRDRAVVVGPQRVELASGAAVDADFVVIATGSKYAAPATVDATEVDAALAELTNAHSAVSAATCIVIYGAGPIGLELAGELAAHRPELDITIVDPTEGFFGQDFKPEVHQALRAQLESLGVRLRLGLAMPLPDTPPATLASFAVSAPDGTAVTGDVWFRCFGGHVVLDHLGPELQGALSAHGLLRVDEYLRVVGHDRTFALGDVIDQASARMAARAMRQSAVVAANILDVAAGRAAATRYEPLPPAIMIPLGPHAGAGQQVDGTLQGAEQVSEFIGKNLGVDGIAAMLSSEP